MAKDVKHKAAKAITKLAKQTAWRQVKGELRDAVKEQTKHSTRRLAYDLNGDPH